DSPPFQVGKKSPANFLRFAEKLKGESHQQTEEGLQNRPLMKILVIGSGGREHALTWALARSRAIERIYTPSHNAGILQQAMPVDISPNDISALADFAARESIALTVVGPEQPLVDGFVDVFTARGLPCFGPVQSAA